MSATDAAIQVRPERAEDTTAIELLTLVAYLDIESSRHDEHAIIAALRVDDALTVSLLAEHDGYVVGYAAASAVAFAEGGRGWYALGPLAVGPGHRRQGVGARLVAAVLDALRAAGAAGCLVLGDPLYWQRFGFAAEPGLILDGVLPAAASLLALPFGDHLPPLGTVRYHPAFSY